MVEPKAPFQWRPFQSAIIRLHVRWYCRYALSDQDLADMMTERGVEVDHTKIDRWVQDDTPAVDKCIRPLLKPTHASWRVDETDIDIKGEWKYLYRAVASAGHTLDFRLSANRAGKAAGAFSVKCGERSTLQLHEC